MIYTLSYAEIMNLLQRDIPMRARALICFQYASGCRIGELLYYKHKDGSITHGLLKSKIHIGEEVLEWEMPNFKVKNEKKKIKRPFILKEESVLWGIANDWLSICGEQVFEIRQSRARTIIREQLGVYSSHALRRSRGTHLVDKFGYNIYEIMDTLGHTKMESGMAYISTSKRKEKMRKKLREMHDTKTN